MKSLRLFAVVAFGLLLLPRCVSASAADTAAPKIEWDAAKSQARLTTGDLELLVDTARGINARSLRDVKTGSIFADGDYCWPNGKFPAMTSQPDVQSLADGVRSITFKGKLDSLEIEQTFTLPNEPGVILESIAIRNPTDAALATADFKCGFTKRLGESGALLPDANGVSFSPIPYRRETNGQMQEFPLREIAEHGMTYTGWMEPVVPTPIWGAEGWVWMKNAPAASGESPRASTFLVAKYNRDSMEWSLMEPVRQGDATRVRFAGAGQWKHGHPEGAARLEPGKSYRFGETRLQAVAGDWKQAYYAYRKYLASKGCKPNAYDPPLQWNELYDNEYFNRFNAILVEYVNPGKPGFNQEFYDRNKKLLNEYYSLEIIKREADKAKDLGCEALYLDPGWEIGWSRQVWDTERMGPMPAFVKMLREQYGMRGVCFWCSLGGVPPTYNDTAACPKEAQVLDQQGNPVQFLDCFPSPGFLDTKEQNLLELAKNGAVFFMFDSDQYSGPCFDKTHGHAIPSTREEHAKALFELARRVKAKYPKVLIELHDPITGPSNIHYTPSYFGYQPPQSFDCLWGHEFMWNSMDDLLSRRAVSLYYFNLAYDIPFYLHVGLNTDNANALVFWWYASTCRHLGVGGKHADPAVWEAQKNAVRRYKELKRFYTQGEFFGLDETVHAHTLVDQKQSVINLFNLDDQPVERQIKFRLAEIGLPNAPVKIEGVPFTQNGDEITLRATIPARGHVLCKVQ